MPGDKFFNRILSRDFEMRYYAAGLQWQDGPSWILNVANHYSFKRQNEVHYIHALVKRYTNLKLQ